MIIAARIMILAASITLKKQVEIEEHEKQVSFESKA